MAWRNSIALSRSRRKAVAGKLTIAAAAQSRRGMGYLIEPLETRRLLSGTVFVDAIAPGTDDGSSWANAYTDLQQALAAVVAGQTIEVSQGTYLPTSGTDRTATFQLVDGVTIQGGYAGYGQPNPDAQHQRRSDRSLWRHWYAGR